jgi:hemerythrin-like domain-containing protein
VCEYCGCQQIAAIDELTREHDAIIDAFGRIRSRLEAGQTDEVAGLCRYMLAVLAPHTAVEEQGLFPAMAAEFPDHVHQLRSEHERIEAVLTEACEGIDTDPTLPDRLLGMMFLLREHILKEQDGVFPAALMSLSPAQWDDLDEIRARVGSALIPQPS